jgi:2-hydroxychromene-2-carboxylate isomerase
MTATFTVIGDFADPMSYLASQRVTRLQSLGIADVTWCAVTAQSRLPRAGVPLSEPAAVAAARVALPGEFLPAPGTIVPGSGAASAAYAESLTESLANPAVRPSIADRMRAALFDALWVEHRRIDDPEVIRKIAFDVFDAGYARADARRRAADNQSIVPLVGTHPVHASRRSGFLVSLAGAPLTNDGQQRLDTWRRAWQAHGAPALPVVTTSQGETLTGADALRRLERLLQPATSTQLVDDHGHARTPVPA